MAALEIWRDNVQPQPVLEIEGLQRRPERIALGVYEHQSSSAHGQVSLLVGEQLVEVALAQSEIIGGVSAVDELPLGVQHPDGAIVLDEKVRLELEHASGSDSPPVS